MKRSTVDKILASLDGGAEGWSFGAYEAFHRKSRTSIWIANSYYGLHVIADGVKFGDVTFASSFFGPLIPWRRKLLRAARAAAMRRTERALSGVDA